MFLSFVIPLYNCEKYIIRCLDSICDSSIPHDAYEILVINDGSTDNGPELCCKYIRHKIDVYHQVNSGQASARNLGLKYAKGDYIWFVDADDMIVSLAVSQLQDEIAKDDSWDLVSFNYQMEYAEEIKKVRIVDERIEFKAGVDYLKKKQKGSYLWNNIYKRASLNKLFVEHTSHIEDMCFNVQNILLFKRILYLDIEGYVYNRTNVSSTSQTHNKEATDKANKDAFKIYSILHQDMMNTKDAEKKAYLKKLLNFGVAGHVYTMAKETQFRDIMSYIQKYKKLGLYPIKRTDSKKANLFILIANCKPLLYAYCRCKWHRCVF